MLSLSSGNSPECGGAGLGFLGAAAEAGGPADPALQLPQLFVTLLAPAFTLFSPHPVTRGIL
jgi:hypothetical protein